MDALGVLDEAADLTVPLAAPAGTGAILQCRPVDVALVTCRSLPEPDPDAEPLAAALAAAGLRCAALAWDDPAADWAQARLTVLRSCWNYYLHREAFLGWAEATARLSTLWNPLPAVTWSSHKGYLFDLERRGVPIAPTVLLGRGARVSLESIRKQRGWSDVVVKPAVSAASYRTLRATAGDLGAGEAHLRALLAEGEVLVQQYLPSGEEYGERALVSIDGELTHAVRKSPRLAGQDESVSSEAVPIAASEAALALRSVAAAGGQLLYARVDVAPGPDGEPVLMELELIEPSLYFLQCPAALDRFVTGVRRLLKWVPR